ncbi:MAG: beta-ketoacyl-[acyl-carrier-protein] synthase family protein [Acidobacteriota bacterium]
MSSPSVAVTGLGAVSAFGWGVEPLWRGLCSGDCALGPFDRFEHSAYATHLAGQVPPAPAELAAKVADWRRLAWADRFALAASLEATAGGLPQGTVGAFFASSTGGMLEGEKFYGGLERFAGEGSDQPGIAWLVSQQVSSPAENVARTLGLQGPVETVSSACASGTLALGLALDALRSGEVDAALVGGADSLCRTTYSGFNSLRSVDERPCRPFRDDRAGLSIGEGGAALLLEPLESARRRDVEILALLAGSGASSDSHHMTAPQPEGEGAARALRRAIADAGLEADDLSFVNAHGTGTPHNDAAEWRALEAILGSAAETLPVTSSKACVGHLLGSAGCLEAVATVLGLVHGKVHPTPGDGAVDPALPVALVTGEARAVAGRHAVSLNLAFGGCNAAAVFSRP